MKPEVGRVPGRPIRVAVIGPADLVDRVANAGRTFSGLEVWALAYERADQAAALYALACGNAGAEGAVAEPADAVLFTGPIGYRHGTRGVPIEALPTAYVPYSPLWLYAPLFGVDDRRSLCRVTLDSLDPGVLDATYRELGLTLEAAAVYCGSADDPSADEVAAFHRRAMEEGRSTHALTCLLAVHRRLRDEGLACTWLVPSHVAIEEALEKLFYMAEGVRARGAQIVMGLARPREDGRPFGADRLRLKAHELLLSQVEDFDGHLVDSGSGDFQFFTTRAGFEAATLGYSQWPLSSGLAAAGVGLHCGVGLGATAGEAGANARAALEEALRSKDSACFVMLDTRRLIGPLGPEALAYSLRSTDLALLDTAREVGVAVASLRRALAALGGTTSDFTARDLAVWLRVGLRTAHRILLKLRQAGYVVEVGQESAGTRGRPRRVFRLRSGPNQAKKEEDVLEGEGAGGRPYGQ